MQKANRWTLWIRVIVVAYLLGGACFAPSPARSHPSGDFAALDGFIRSQMARHLIPGLAVAITQGDEIVYVHGYGTAGEGREVTPETPFYIGSVSKSFTALAVMQLVDEGKIDLDAPVRSYSIRMSRQTRPSGPL